MDQTHRIVYGLKDDVPRETIFSIRSTYSDVEPTDYKVIHYNVLSVLEFLIGHEPFVDNLSYGPVRQWTSEGKRIYNEMHTAEWWWTTQRSVQGDSQESMTVVPLNWFSDKVEVTRLHGDQKVWAVYMTIGNLDRATRRSQTRPGTVLLGFIPILYGEHKGYKANVFHAAMEAMFKR